MYGMFIIFIYLQILAKKWNREEEVLTLPCQLGEYNHWEQLGQTDR